MLSIHMVVLFSRFFSPSRRSFSLLHLVLLHVLSVLYTFGCMLSVLEKTNLEPRKTRWFGLDSTTRSAAALSV